MEIDLISLLFDSVTTSLQSFIANDICVMLLGMISITFIIFAYFKIREFLGIGMSSEALDARSAFRQYQIHKDSWRAPIYKTEYEEKLSAYSESERYSVTKKFYSQ